MEPTGAIERAVARLVLLIPLLLSHRRDRRSLLEALSRQLAAYGWHGAIRQGTDGLPMLKRDIHLIRTLGLVTLDSSRSTPPEPGPHLPLWVTPQEARALTLAANVLEQLGLPEAALVQGLIARVPAGSATESRTTALGLDGSLMVADDAVWQELQTAIARGRQVRLTYRKPGAEPETFILDRGQLVRLTHAWYFCAFRPAHAQARPGLPAWQHVREYRLDRIEAAQALSASVALHELPHFEACFVLSAELRERVFPLHDALGRALLKPEPLPDGTLRVTMRETSLLRASQRLAVYGRHLLHIEGPEALRALVRQTCTEVLANLT